MVATYRSGKDPITRLDFSKAPGVLEIPNLLDIQTKFYENFLQRDKSPQDRKDQGLEEIFKTVFPISDFNNTASLEYVGYEIGIWETPSGEYPELGGPGVVDPNSGKELVYKPIFSKEECLRRSLTYADPLKILVRLVIKDIDETTKEERIREVKEQKVYLGDIPIMTDVGTFIINGTERVAVSQLHRSPGVFFMSDKGKGAQAGQINYSARLIPYRGSWLDFEFDAKDILNARIDRKRKYHATIILKALGYDDAELLDFFYDSITVKYDPDRDSFSLPLSRKLVSIGIKPIDDIKDANGNVIVRKDRKLNRRMLRSLENASLDKIEVSSEELIGRYIAYDVVDMQTGEIILETNTPITDKDIVTIRDNKIEEIKIIVIDEQSRDTSFRDTLEADKVSNKDEALREIYKRMRPGDYPTFEAAQSLFENLFFNPKRYDLLSVGRLKLNERLKTSYPLTQRILTREDILLTIKALIDLKRGKGHADDIDHLGNRRIRSVGESVENQFRIGLVRMEKTIIERMNMTDFATCMPHDLINSKPIAGVIKEFFGSSQLSQFMDQTNPLSAVTHKRRLSALGPGGLTRERAGFEVRDVHPSHYGRICPIETPEGPNIGLISSLSTYARVNDFGFIETPYRKIVDGVATDEIVYMTATEEDSYTIAQANAVLDESGRFVMNMISCRKGGEYTLAAPAEVDYMDVSPKQLVSVAASLIPFLENDDANRALMGSNMQRQAVPLLKTEAPLVGTGMEKKVAIDSGSVVTVKRSGEVIYVDSSRIVVRTDATSQEDSQVDIYRLVKYMRSNQNTCINQVPIVSKGQKVKVGDVIADGQSTDRGELALGRNVLVAFMPWYGYNFEDAIIVSEKLVKNDAFTSIHIEEFEIEARDTRQGKEEITRDIPNVSEISLRNLDSSGIVRIGAKVSSGDILVGKLTPKGETMLSPEEKLLKAIFGEKAGDVRDTSLTVPPGNSGIVINTMVFTRRGIDKDERTLEMEDSERVRLEKDQEDEIRITVKEAREKIVKLVLGKSLSEPIQVDDSVILEKGQYLTHEVLSSLSNEHLNKLFVGDPWVDESVRKIVSSTEDNVRSIRFRYEDLINKFSEGDELAPGVIKIVKVYVAIKRKLQVGDKMAGRHGNKGVVSIIVPEEDMPYTEDGRPIELVLNPLGVPSRMNVGQILETNLGMAAKILNKHVCVPVFECAQEENVVKMMQSANYPENGKIHLVDGKTGERFDQRITVGCIYMMKLHHLVDDKIHARSTGPYSLVTQQPLGGKAQFGGQRLGEMEVWALEGYGAAHTLQEMLTVKSDDVEGRKRMYESIVRGDHTLSPGLPESFNVLVKELQALALDIELIQN